MFRECSTWNDLRVLWLFIFCVNERVQLHVVTHLLIIPKHTNFDFFSLNFDEKWRFYFDLHPHLMCYDYVYFSRIIDQHYPLQCLYQPNVWWCLFDPCQRIHWNLDVPAMKIFFMEVLYELLIPDHFDYINALSTRILRKLQANRQYGLICSAFKMT